MTGQSVVLLHHIERLHSLVQYLRMTPNAFLTYAKTLESRMSGCFLRYGTGASPMPLVSLSPDSGSSQGATTTSSDEDSVQLSGVNCNLYDEPNSAIDYDALSLPRTKVPPAEIVDSIFAF